MLLSQAELNKLHLAFFVAFELGLMAIVELLHIFVGDCDAISKIRGLKSNDSHVEFVVAALKIFIELAFGHWNACGQETLDFLERQLIPDQLLDMLFPEPP